ncbi:FtsX-like permease family protein [Lacticaseibacillus sp. GG6-2]
MRFLERAIKALSYHRWLYLASTVVVFCFTLLSVCLLTANQLNLNSQNGFKSRLCQFDTGALHSANHLIAEVQSAYTQVSVQYQAWWADALIGLALVAGVTAIGAAYHRRRETTAYLLVGKSPADIVAQYLLENFVVFAGGFVLAMIVAIFLTQTLNDQLLGFNRYLIDHHLSSQLSATTFDKITKQLFAHRITDFSGNDLVFAHRKPQPLNSQLIGGWQTFVSGAATVLITQGVVLSASIWWQRLRLRHHG